MACVIICRSPTMARNFSVWMLPRFLNVAVTLLWILARIAAFRLQAGIGLSSFPSTEEREARLVARQLERLGGLWVKIGQYLSCRRDLLSQTYCLEFTRLQTRVEPMSEADARLAISRVAALHPGLVVDPAPLAAGCIAQVHGAQGPEGVALILKIRRPGIVDKVAVDRALFVGAASAVERLRRFSGVPAQRVARELCQLMHSQLDLRREAESLSTMAPMLRGWGIGCPTVVAVSDDGDWLLMTRASGQHIENVLPASAQSAQLARSGIVALYNMLFDTGQVHADLHPGNVLVAEQRLVFVDFGLVVTLTKATRHAFRDFFLAFSTGDGLRCSRILIDTALLVPADQPSREFETAVTQVISSHYGRNAHCFEVVAFVKDIFDVQRRFGIIGGTDFCAAILSLLVFEAVVKRIDPACDFQGLARIALPPIIARHAPRRPWGDEVTVSTYPSRFRFRSLLQQQL